MQRLRTQRGQVLIILLGALLLGGSGIVVGTLSTGHDIDELKSRVKHAVADPQRAREVRALLDDWEHQGKAYWKAVDKDHKTILTALERHDGKAEDFEPTLADIGAREAASFGQFLELRSSLKARLTPQEWQLVFAP
jgi:hypothetical protein